MAERPGWLGGVGGDVMTSEAAKAYVQEWNGKDLTKIDQNSESWTKFAAFASDPESQAAMASLGLLAKDITAAAVAFVGSKGSAKIVSGSKGVISPSVPNAPLGLGSTGRLSREI